MAPDNKRGNSFIDSPDAQAALYAISAAFCLFYAASGVRELLVAQNAQLIESIGETAYYAITILRVVVLAITGAAFVRVALRAYRRTKDR